MVRRLKQLSLLLLMLTILAGANLAMSQSASASTLPVNITVVAAQDAPARCNKGFLGLKPWYHYMNNGLDPDTCQVKCFNIFQQMEPNDCGQRRSDIPGVLLAIIDDLLRIAGLVSIAFIFAGAFKFIESRGNSEKTAQAQSTIINALAGLAVALVSVGFVAFLGSRLN